MPPKKKQVKRKVAPKKKVRLPRVPTPPAPPSRPRPGVFGKSKTTSVKKKGKTTILERVIDRLLDINKTTNSSAKSGSKLSRSSVEELVVKEVKKLKRNQWIVLSVIIPILAPIIRDIIVSFIEKQMGRPINKIFNQSSATRGSRSSTPKTRKAETNITPIHTRTVQTGMSPVSPVKTRTVQTGMSPVSPVKTRTVQTGMSPTRRPSASRPPPIDTTNIQVDLSPDEYTPTQQSVIWHNFLDRIAAEGQRFVESRACSKIIVKILKKGLGSDIELYEGDIHRFLVEVSRGERKPPVEEIAEGTIEGHIECSSSDQ
jgi:hypothetical protein